MPRTKVGLDVVPRITEPKQVKTSRTQFAHALVYILRKLVKLEVARVTKTEYLKEECVIYLSL